MNEISVKDVFVKHFPDEYIMIGDSALGKIINQKVKIERSDFGDEIDLFELFAYTANVVEFISNAINVHLFLKKQSIENTNDLVPRIKKVIEEKKTYTMIDEDKQTIIIEHVIKTTEYD